MPGKAAVVVTASALSVTIGVLIGIVLIIGNKARAPSDAVASTSAATTAFHGPAPVSGDVPLSEGGVAQISVLAVASSPATTTSTTPASVGTVSSSSKVTGRAVTSTPRRPAAARPTRPPGTTSSKPKPTATRPSIVYTTVTIAPPTSSSLAPSTPSSSTPTLTLTTIATPTPTPTPTPTTTTAAAALGGPAAPGRPCAALGEQATAAGGFTVFCQHDFSNGSLAWRAVVDGGGCLSKKMTGIGIDGQHYRCRPDRGGLDHWRRA